MALQPDQVHEAEASNDQWLPDLINQEFLYESEFPGIADGIPDLLLQTTHDYVDRSEFENAPGPAPQLEALRSSRRWIEETKCIDPRLLHQQPFDQVPSLASDPGDRPIDATAVADSGVVSTEVQTVTQRTHRQHSSVRRERSLKKSDKPISQNRRRQGKRKGRCCLKCRDNRKPCTHHTDENAELLPEFIDKYSMLFVEMGHLKRMMRALYEKVTTLGSATQISLRSDNSPISLYMALKDQSSVAGLGDEHVVRFDPGRLQNMLRTAGTDPIVMQPAISVVDFDYLISKSMWPDHGQQADSRITRAQKNILETMRMFCGYFTLLCNLNQVEIYSEYTQQRTAKLACIALVYLFIHRLCHLYQGLGHNLQALVDKAEHNHYIAARSLEPIYRCLQILKWSTANQPILQQLDDIQLLLNERIPVIKSEIGDIERNFVPPYRGDGRLKNNPTMEAAGKLKLPRRLRIYFERQSLWPSINMMPTRNGRWSMYTVPDLLSSGDIYDLPPSDQASGTSFQLDLHSVNHGLLPLDNGESSRSSGTSTTQTRPASRRRAAFNAQLQSQSAQTNAATRPSTIIDADPGNGSSSFGGPASDLTPEHSWHFR